MAQTNNIEALSQALVTIGEQIELMNANMYSELAGITLQLTNIARQQQQITNHQDQTAGQILQQIQQQAVAAEARAAARSLNASITRVDTRIAAFPPVGAAIVPIEFPATAQELADMDVQVVDALLAAYGLVAVAGVGAAVSATNKALFAASIGLGQRF
ncbi:hypothetical protein HK100_012094 [Physocladia obscura]|uniref:Uncharacterized protein n=1 Tax=Physocladia obscura TaxID=109957 RepID=A0AAD5TAW3_9FUNG|nr:hypothetical protein HK100_012094 [Physocladia obscura]